MKSEDTNTFESPSPSSSLSSFSKQASTEELDACSDPRNLKLAAADNKNNTNPRDSSSKNSKVQQKVRRALTGNENTRVRDHARQNIKRTSVVVKKQVRKVVTGNANTRLRDWAKEAKVVKTVDKFSFFLGVTVLLATEFVFLERPDLFGHYYVVLVSVMMALRLYMYAKNKWLYFLIDFCYGVNASCFVSVLLFPNNTALWRLNYALTNGTLLGAILAWRNSFVFHSLDKVTSIAIHLLPALLTFLERWKTDSNMCLTSAMNSGSLRDEDVEYADCRIGIRGALVEPLAFYACWQLLYILKTEIMDRQVMRANPNIQTSLRWLTRDSKNAMHQIAKRTCRTLGLFGPTEEFDPESLKTKCVFWTFNFLFVVLTLLPTPILFTYSNINTAYILFVLAAAIYNGGNYYFEVFAARYMQKLEDQQREIEAERRAVAAGAATTNGTTDSSSGGTLPASALATDDQPHDQGRQQEQAIDQNDEEVVVIARSGNGAADRVMIKED